jgi:hypothetical protein
MPKVQKSSPCQQITYSANHPYQQSTYQQLGGRRQGRSLKIRRTAAGGAGRVEQTGEVLIFQNLAAYTSPTPAAGSTNIKRQFKCKLFQT